MVVNKADNFRSIFNWKDGEIEVKGAGSYAGQVIAAKYTINGGTETEISFIMTLTVL